MKSATILNKLGNVLETFNPLSRRATPATPKNEKVSIKQLTHQDMTWIDVTDPTRKELAILTSGYGFDPLEIKSCVSKGQLDRIEVEDGYSFILLHAPRYHKKSNKIVTTRICFFVSKKYLISIHKNTHESFPAIMSEAESDSEKKADLFKKSPSHLLYYLLESLTKDTTLLVETVSNQVDEIEDLVFDVSVSGAYEITQMRQKILKLKRVITPFKTILQELALDQNCISNSMARSFKYLANDVNKLRESLEDAKEVIEIYKDADFTMSTDRTNKILGILTIIFTLAIPAQIVGSFYGMNVFIPGGIEAGPWTWLGPFTTFYIVVFLAIAPAALMLWFFKRSKWF